MLRGDSLGFQGECEYSSGFGSRCAGAGVRGGALAVQVRGGHASSGVLGAVTKGGGKRAGARLIVMGVLAVVDCAEIKYK